MKIYLASFQIDENIIKMAVPEADDVPDHWHDGQRWGIGFQRSPPVCAVHTVRPQFPEKIEYELDQRIKQEQCRNSIATLPQKYGYSIAVKSMYSITRAEGKSTNLKIHLNPW